jgi:hypothetical protein
MDQKTGVGDVRDFHGVMTSQNFNFHLGVIVTNTSLTADGKWFALQNSKLLRLRDLVDLCRWMRGDFSNDSEWREIPDNIELAPGAKIAVPRKALWVPSGDV